MRSTRQEVSAAKEPLGRLLEGNRYVQGIGITTVADGYALKVLLATGAELTPELPAVVDGVMVVYEVVGEVNIQASAPTG